MSHQPVQGVVEPMGGGRKAATRSLDPSHSSDLVLEKEELEMLRIFHRSFNLPGLRLGIINPVCVDDYFPEEEGGASRAPEDDAAAQLAAVRPQTEDLLERAAALLSLNEEITEEIVDSPFSQNEASQMASGSRPHSRTVRTRPQLKSAGRR